MKKFAYLFVCLFAGSANATVFDFEYGYDGTNFTEINGSSSIFGTVLSSGDTVNLSIVAVGNSYWDVSAAGSLFAGNLGFTEYGTRASSGAYSIFSDGLLQASNAFNNSSQSAVHAGPNYLDFTGISAFDQLDLSITLNSSTASGNTINGWTSNTWNIFGINGHYAVDFVYDPQQVSESASLALLCLGLAGIGFARKKKLA